MTTRPPRRVPCGVLLAAVALGAFPFPVDPLQPPEDGQLVRNSDQPNVIVVMVDDVSMELPDDMPAVRGMIGEGVTFDNMIVSTPLCCPSRATFLAGQSPHNTGVRTNGRRHEGFARYTQERDRDLGRSLQLAGYRTGLIENKQTARVPPQRQAGPER